MSDLGEIIKGALLNLIVKANGATYKGETDLTSCVNSLVKGYGKGGDCTGLHVIPVDKLPDEDIDVSAIYMVPDEKCIDVGIYDSDGQYMSVVVLLEALFGIPITIFSADTLDEIKEPLPSPLYWYYCRLEQQLYGWDEDKQAWDKSDGEDEDSIGKPGWVVNNDYAFCRYDDVGFRDILLVDSGLQQSITALLAGSGAEYSYNTIPTKATEGIKESVIADAITESKFHFYYIEGEKDIFCYVAAEDTGVKDWYSISLWFASEDQEYAFQKAVDDMTEATETGYYAVGKKGWRKHITPHGTVVITEANKAVDVRNFASVYVYRPEYDGEVVYE